MFYLPADQKTAVHGAAGILSRTLQLPGLRQRLPGTLSAWTSTSEPPPGRVPPTERNKEASSEEQLHLSRCCGGAGWPDPQQRDGWRAGPLARLETRLVQDLLAFVPLENRHPEQSRADVSR